jgi:hypothetical protein
MTPFIVDIIFNFGASGYALCIPVYGDFRILFTSNGSLLFVLVSTHLLSFLLPFDFLKEK